MEHCTRLAGAARSWAAFAVLAVGAPGRIGGGLWARRVDSARAAAWQLGASGLCCLLAPWLLHAGDLVFGAWLLLWGISVAGDSPQFSALTAANAPPRAVDSVLTLANNIGFAISILGIQLALFGDARQFSARPGAQPDHPPVPAGAGGETRRALGGLRPGHRASAVFHAMQHIKPRLCRPGVVANPRDTYGYHCGLRLARTTNPSVFLSAAQRETLH